MDELVKFETRLVGGSIYFCEDYHLYLYENKEEVIRNTTWCGHSSGNISRVSLEKLLINLHGFMPKILSPKQNFMVVDILSSINPNEPMEVYPVQILSENRVGWIKVHNLMSFVKII